MARRAFPFTRPLASRHQRKVCVCRAATSPLFRARFLAKESRKYFGRQVVIEVVRDPDLALTAARLAGRLRRFQRNQSRHRLACFRDDYLVSGCPLVD
jgi:hypothetical protein